MACPFSVSLPCTPPLPGTCSGDSPCFYSTDSLWDTHVVHVVLIITPGQGVSRCVLPPHDRRKLQLRRCEWFPRVPRWPGLKKRGLCAWSKSSLISTMRGDPIKSWLAGPRSPQGKKSRTVHRVPLQDHSGALLVPLHTWRSEYCFGTRENLGVHTSLPPPGPQHPL